MWLRFKKFEAMSSADPTSASGAVQEARDTFESERRPAHIAEPDAFI